MKYILIVMWSTYGGLMPFERGAVSMQEFETEMACEGARINIIVLAQTSKAKRPETACVPKGPKP